LSLLSSQNQKIMIQLIMPKMGESVAEATILKWLKKEGDAIAADEPVLEIATDKVDSEVPAPSAGVLSKRLFEEGQVVKVGEVIALMTAAGETAAPAAGNDLPAGKSISAAPAPAVAAAPAAAPVLSAPAAPAPARIPEGSSSGKFYSPLVRTIARQEGVSSAELDSIRGSGLNDRVTKTDLMNFLEQRGRQTEQPSVAAAAPAPAAARPPAPQITVSGQDEIIEMDRMRRLIADHMVMSKHRVKGAFEKREREKLTFTPIFIEAVAKAIRDFPMVNVSVDGQRIIIRKNVNIGMATALPSGNLIVPVIRNADMLNLVGLTKAVNDLAARARNNKLLPDEIQGGTYTLTNVGTFGNVMGTPIINQPQVAILAVGAIRKKPAVIETAEGDFIGIRHMMFLSHAYDHRVVDGALGGSFVRRVADYLEQFDPGREI
jgi:2-oxoglutarate dehydrogenase E2 component (dihydrolipoamide succinyltransferase)